MNLGELQLTIENVTGRRRNIAVVSIEEKFKRDKETKKVINELEGYQIMIGALGGSIQPVTIGVQFNKKVCEAREALAKGAVVLVNFEHFKGSAYAFINGARLHTGVSCSAQGVDFKIIDVEEDTNDEEEFKDL